MSTPDVLLLIDQDLLHSGVGKTFFTADNGFGKFFLFEMPLAGKVEDGSKGIAILVGHQAAEIVGEPFRQHGDDTSREVDGCAALVSFLVKGRTRLNIMADISNGDIKAVAVTGFLNRNGVIKVFGCLAINGDVLNVAKVKPAFYRDNFIGNCCYFCKGFVTEGVGKAMLFYDQPHLYINGIRISQNLNQGALLLAGVVALSLDFHNDRVTLSEFFRQFSCKLNHKRITGIFRIHQRVSGFHGHKTGQLVFAPFKNGEYFSLRTAILFHFEDSHQNLVAVAGRTHIGR